MYFDIFLIIFQIKWIKSNLKCFNFLGNQNKFIKLFIIILRINNLLNMIDLSI